ncbi:putative conjugative transfer protein TraI [Legionella donaldsonii]|uniref:Putative conjugative transfer protein TraI n=1 Tax=Legionella donaldsonii TaxID=45060 RepID=A0A378KN83_9GAMM|nr:AAA family ATPase [Legionella donaldsonii]STX84931.1 putative conjugative transfer protein TraI [Legionella donaldsonii]
MALSEALISPKAQDSNMIAETALSFATAKLAEREAAFDHKELLMEAMVFAMGKASLADIEQAIADKEAQGDLMHANTRWVVREAYLLEKKILSNNREGQGVVQPIMAESAISLPETLTQGQKEAVTLSLTTSDRFVTVQGLAGTGKTTMMREIKRLAENSGFKVQGLAPMNTSKDELQRAGIGASTIASFLTLDTPYPEKCLFIVDEASMIGNEDYLYLQEKAKTLNARLLFAGDRTQMQSPASGIPHELTLETKTQASAQMDEILRQSPNPVLKKAVVHASNREIESSFATLSTINPEKHIKRLNQESRPLESVVTVDCRDEKGGMDYHRIYQAIAEDYLTRLPEQQAETLVIAHAHEDRAAINALIRDGLKAQGVVAGEEVFVKRLVARHLTQAELLTTASYKPGDMLRFNASYSVARRGDYFKVSGIDEKLNRLHCQDSQGLEFSINPALIAGATRLSVYEEKEGLLAAGDRICLRLTDKRRGHIANKDYTVASIAGHQAALKHQEETLQLDLTQHKDCHWDYAYTATALGAQGSTATFVLALELAKRSKATTHRSHEIDITRARQQVTLYTENKEALIKRLSTLKGDKTSAWQTYETAQINQPKIGQSNTHRPLNPAKTQISAEVLNKELTHQMASLTHHLLGEPNHSLSSKTNLRYGSKGSLSINLGKGLWFNFETGEKGNALQLIAAQMGFNDFKDTLDYAKTFINHREENYRTEKPRVKKKEPVIKESPNKKAYAQKLYAQSVPLEGTLGERYLKHHRHLTDYAQAQLRFLPAIATWHQGKKAAVPAVLAVAKDLKGEVNHAQVIRLNPLTGEKDKQSTFIKQTYGSPKGFAIDLNPNAQSKASWFCEGLETGLSVVSADKSLSVKALLGKSNFLSIDPNTVGKQVVFCLDNDGNKTFSDLIIAKATARLLEAGKSVFIVMPETKGDDFNDVLRRDGLGVLKRQLTTLNDAKLMLKNQMDSLTKDHPEANIKGDLSSLIDHNITTANQQSIAIKSMPINTQKEMEITR